MRAVAVRAVIAVAVAILVCAALPVSAQAERRVALVIGNAAYTDAGRLANPLNDAQDLGTALSRLGFDVTVEVDLGSQQFDQAVNTFVLKARGADVALFFYAGHALQVGATNYLMPVDARLATALAVKRETISAQDVIDLMEGAARMNLVFLDACRNNPVAERLRSELQSTSRAANVGRGLGRIDVKGRDTLIVYSAEPGQVAVDTVGERNSPFAAGLLKHMETPDLEIEAMLKRVTAEVARTTAHKQQPERLSKLVSEFYFKRGLQASMAPIPVLPTPPQRPTPPQQPALDPIAMTIRVKLGGSTVDGKERGRLGVAGLTIQPGAGALFGSGVRSGILVTSVLADGPAAGTDLRPLDLITEIDGIIPGEMAHFTRLIGDLPPGHTVELRIRRLAASTTEALDGLRRLAEANNTSAQLLLGSLHLGGDLLSRDPALAVEWYRRAAEGGNARAMNDLGVMLQNGRGIGKDEAEAVRWFRKSAEAGDEMGMIDLGMMLQGGRGAAKDEAEAVRWFRKAADAGDALGMTSLAAMLELGRGIAKNEAEAVRWYRKAADAGYAPGMTFLGAMYFTGSGVTKSEKEAVHWFRKAADAGDVRSMLYLGVALQNGRGVAKSEAEAVRWYKKAAESGFPPAMNNLSAMLEAGRGVARDRKAAAQWVFRSLRTGDAVAHAQMRKNADGWSTEFRHELQRLMRQEGAYSGPIDGNTGAAFRTALDKLKPRKE